MRARHGRGPGRGRLIGLFGVTLILAACSGTAASSAPSAAAPVTAAPAPSAAAPSEAAAASPSQNDKPLEIAYLSFAVANSYDAPMLAAAQAAAAAGNAKLTVFDAKLNPADQTKQLQDAVASGKYDGVITAAGVRGRAGRGRRRPPSRPDVAVGSIDQVLGTDNDDARTSQVPSRPQRERGVRPERARPEDRRAGRRGLRRPQGEPVQRRVHLVGQGGRAGPGAEGGVRHGDRPPTPSIKVVADSGESFYTTADRPGGEAPGHASRRTPTIIVIIVGADQAITGAVQAVRSAGRRGQGPAGGLRRRRRSPSRASRRASALRDGRADARQPRVKPGHGAADPGHPDRRAGGGRGRPLADLPDGGVVTQGQRRHVPAARGVAGLTPSRSS